VGLLGGEGGSAAGVDAALLGRGDALALAFADQGALELGEGAHDRQQQGGHRGVFAGEGEVLRDELHPDPLAGQVRTSRRRSSRLRASRSIECTITVSPSRTNASSSASLGRVASLPEAVSVKTRSTATRSSWRTVF